MGEELARYHREEKGKGSNHGVVLFRGYLGSREIQPLHRPLREVSFASRSSRRWGPNCFGINRMDSKAVQFRVSTADEGSKMPLEIIQRNGHRMGSPRVSVKLPVTTTSSSPSVTKVGQDRKPTEFPNRQANCWMF